MRKGEEKGMVLPFDALSMAFNHVYYSVDLPSVHLLLRNALPSALCMQLHRIHWPSASIQESLVCRNTSLSLYRAWMRAKARRSRAWVHPSWSC